MTKNLFGSAIIKFTAGVLLVGALICAVIAFIPGVRKFAKRMAAR